MILPACRQAGAVDYKSMQFTIKNLNRSINDIMRAIGYKPAYFQNDGQVSIVRQLGGNDYPRFHLYIKEGKEELIFDLHLDQRKPSYEGSHGHNGEYEGEIIQSEAERIDNLLG